MRYVPFRLDKENFQKIFDIPEEQLDRVYDLAMGEKLLTKSIEEVNMEDVRIFISYQRDIKIINQLLGCTPEQPHLDVEKEIIKTLENNKQVKSKDPVQNKSNDIINRPPIHMGYVNKKTRWNQRWILHYLYVHHLQVPEEKITTYFKESSHTKVR